MHTPGDNPGTENALSGDSASLDSASAADGQRLTVSIEKLVHGGEGLARTPEGVLLVPRVLPGETAEVETEPRRQGVRRARLTRLASVSADRITPECPHFARCGGCQFQHIPYDLQLRLKQEIFEETFQRIGKFPLDAPVTVLASPPWRYRNRVRLRVSKQAEQFEIGYLEFSSHLLCPVEQCPIASDSINAALGALQAGTGAALFSDGEAELELFAAEPPAQPGPQPGARLLATVYAAEAPAKEFGEHLMRELPAIESVCWKQHGGPERNWGSGCVVCHAGEFAYRVSHHSFFQSNRFLLGGMVEAVVDDLGGERALELYAGVGLFTLPLAQRYENVAAVEADRSSARDLACNAAVAGHRVRAYHATAEKFLARLASVPQAILANPPRSGLTKAVTGHLLRLRPQRFVYVSCEPATLARDLAAMTAAGYRLRSVHLADQFPQTYHLESIVHLELAP